MLLGNYRFLLPSRFPLVSECDSLECIQVHTNRILLVNGNEIKVRRQSNNARVYFPSVVSSYRGTRISVPGSRDDSKYKHVSSIHYDKHLGDPRVFNRG